MNAPAKLEIQRLTSNMLDEILRIHLAGMGYSLNARLGRNHLKYLYTVMAADPDCYVGVALKDGRPAGVVSGAVDAVKFAGKLMGRMPARRLLWIAFQMLFHPGLIWLWVQGNAIARPVLANAAEVRAVLTAIVVDSQIQSHGVGRALVLAFEGFLREAGVQTYRLDTRIENLRAADFYRNLGFAEVARRADSIIFVRNLPA